MDAERVEDACPDDAQVPSAVGDPAHDRLLGVGLFAPTPYATSIVRLPFDSSATIRIRSSRAGNEPGPLTIVASRSTVAGSGPPALFLATGVHAVSTTISSIVNAAGWRPRPERITPPSSGSSCEHPAMISIVHRARPPFPGDVSEGSPACRFDRPVQRLRDGGAPLLEPATDPPGRLALWACAFMVVLVSARCRTSTSRSDVRGASTASELIGPIAGASLIAAGCWLRWRRPGRGGVLLALAGIAWSLGEWNNPGVGSSAGFTIGMSSSAALTSALVAHAALAYPSGQLAAPRERAAIALAYAAALIIGFAVALFFDPRRLGCSLCPSNLLP